MILGPRCGSLEADTDTVRTRNNTHIAHRMWDATSRGDAEALRALLAPDVCWRAMGRGDLAGVHHGPDAVVDVLARTGELVDGLCSSLIDVYASEHGAVLRYRMKAQRGLQSIETEMLLRLSIEHGRLIELESVSTDPVRVGSFWRSH